MNSAEFLGPDWPAPAEIHAVVSCRGTRGSSGCYAGLNLAAHVSDCDEQVDDNRSRLQRQLNLPSSPVWLQQVHGNDIACVDVLAPEPPRADAAFTSARGRVCAVLTADCLPVLFCTRDGSRCGVVHAGWRGLQAGILERMVTAMTPSPAELLVWLGPAIGPCHYEVGEELHRLFLESAADTGHRQQRSQAFKSTRPGHYLADLYTLARCELQRAGVPRPSGGDYCTFCDPERFYSYRRDGKTGRFATLIWRE